MRDVNGEECFSQKMFTNELNMGLPEWKHINSLVKEKVQGTVVSKESHADCILGLERSHYYWFPWKRGNSKQSFQLPTHRHHHHVVPLARISLTLSRHFSLSFIAFGWSSGLHPVSSHSCWMYVRAGRPAFAWPYVGVHRSTSLMSLSLLLQQCPACLACLTCIVFVMGGKWPYSWCLVGCCRQDLFNIALNILV